MVMELCVISAKKHGDERVGCISRQRILGVAPIHIISLSPIDGTVPVPRSRFIPGIVFRYPKFDFLTGHAEEIL